ncbi:C4-dicarboxylate ABC transporter permease [Limnohabitans sp. MORI2]|jgi:tripartite ATP-independent transporter DctM subunit|uniref:TRAP transporter large permease n=1 Tax=Limnohabitans sp. MORI2 TaxID=1751150 RepID=UPI002376FA11|nr:TRAP transporter large permease [Limnohabitans sp. MORI2]BDU57850.1 C4-dicarboxylate ABC transporter permease [Limnohabitans sp. MORI2]
MSTMSIGLSMFGAMLVLMAVRVPIAISMFVPGAVGYMALAGWLPLLSHLKGAVYSRVSIYDLSVIPLFMLMGAFAVHGGLSKALFDFANALLGRFKGGMAMAGVLACAAFGSISGSTVATTATIAQVAYPEMRRINYSGRLATAALATGGTMGVLLPPSVTLMVYAILTEQNITKMFLAAYVPALLAAIGYLIAIAVIVRIHPDQAPQAQAASASEVMSSAMNVWPIAAIFLVVFGGIYGGVFTATEGAAIGNVLTFAITLLRREMTFDKLVASIRTTAQTSGMIFLIFIGADMINASLALSQLPAQLADMVGHLQISPLVVMAGIMIFYIILGCVMDEMSMILLTVPTLFPVILGMDFFGLNPSDKSLWFGILILTVCEIGMIFPPVGLNVYIMNGLAKDVPMVETYKGVVPFLITDGIRLSLLIAFPVISLWLVHALT